MQTLTDEEIMVEVGARLRRERMNQELTQQQLGERAGVRQATVSRIEAGNDFSVETLIALLRALHRLDNLDAFLPASPVSPIELADRKGQERQRVRPRPEPANNPAFRWNDEP